MNYKKIFKKYNVNYEISEDPNIIFSQLCKIPNINHTIIKKYIDTNPKVNIEQNLQSIYNNFKHNTDIINNIKILKYFSNKFTKNDAYKIINEVNNKINTFSTNKEIYSFLKSFSIYIRKKISNKADSHKKELESLLKKIAQSTDFNKILKYTHSIINDISKTEIELDHQKVIDIIQSVINNKDIIKDNNIESLLNLINKCKSIINSPNGELESILLKCDKDLYNYIHFLNNKDDLLTDKEDTISFMMNLNYEKKNIKDIDNLSLKRGFIQGLTNTKDNKDYLLKFQPNKSLMELVLNTYIKVLDKPNFLIPSQFFINYDNSYFYIIEKFNMDLYKYFSVLENKNKIMRFQDILYVTSFLMNSIKILHNNNIIHSDLKLENIVVNLNDQTEISELKIIDFDVGLFNIIPESLKPIPDKYLKAFNNKRPRGTRIYMIKDEQMSFKNDIFSLGVILLVILYKNTKLIISVSKKRAIEEAQENRKLILNLQSLIKKLNKLRDDIENNNTKFKLLDVISKFIHSTSNLTNFLNKNEINKFNSFKELIIDCINTKFNINELKNLKYHNLV
jgi:hypothetical protein